MAVFEIDPLEDSRWTALVETHARASIFHTVEWLEALRRTYGYTPVVYTTSPNNVPLANGIVCCRVRSRLTGSKLVSVPFSDHCDPLVRDSDDLRLLLAEVVERTKSHGCKYAEIRPRFNGSEVGNWVPQSRYVFHAIDLRPALEELYSNLHKDGVQRKIRRADREGVVLTEGRSDLLITQFYQLMVLTRRRHGLPPQPESWFRMLVECLGPRLTIHVASAGGQPIASMLTLRHRQTLVYKYGCSDDRVHNMGAMPRLFWHVIQKAKSENLEEFDLGRSDEDNPGLVRFKDHLGANKESIIYWQFPRPPGSGGLNAVLKSSVVQNMLHRMPDSLFRLAGRIFYRHAG